MPLNNRITLLFTFFSFLYISHSFAQDENFSNQRAQQTIQDIGDYAHIGLPIIAGLTTIVLSDSKGTWQFAKSFSMNLATTYILKFAIDKHRPDGRTDGLAFPSGHTSVAFQSASFIQRRYGWSYGIPAYAVASFVAYSRIDGIHKRHDLWDVLGGVIVGVGSTYLFTTPYQKEHLELAFSTSKQNYLIGFRFKF